MSTIVADQLKKALDAVVAFAFHNIVCDHIRVEINHFKETSGTFKVDSHVKGVYTAKGFRWKTLNNDPSTGKRAQIMQLANPQGPVQRQEPFTIKASLVVSLTD